MPRKKTVKESDDIKNLKNENFDNTVVEDVLEENTAAYAPTFISRAIPSVYDGQKEVSRRIIFSGNKHGLTSNKPYKKMLNFVGHVALIHPHGDTAIYDTAIRMAQWWRYNVPMIDGEGNIGSMSSNNDWAASRYVEGRLAAISSTMTDGLNEDAVPTILSEDSVSQEPEVLPAKFPALLTNGGEGIAFGYTSRIIPHNVGELLRAAKALNKNPEITPSELMKRVKGPDLPTGGFIINNDEIKELYKNGKGSITVRAKIEYDKQYNEVVVKELPYGSYRSNILGSITDSIAKYNAESWFKGPPEDDSPDDENIKITLQLNKGVDPDKVISWLYQRTPLEYKFSAVHNVVVNGKIKSISLKEYLEVFLGFRSDTLKRILRFRKGKAEERKEIVEGLIKLVDVTDKVIKKVRAAENKSAAIKAIESLGFTPLQAKSIGNIPLHSLNKQNSIELKEEDKELQDKIDRINQLLTDDDEFRTYLEEDLNETEKVLKPFSTRKTELISADEVKDVKVDASDFIDDTEVVLVAKPNGLQTMTPKVFSNNKDKSPDDIVLDRKLKSSDGVFIFTKNGFVMQRMVADIANSSVRDTAPDWHLDIDDFSFEDTIDGFEPFDIKAKDKDLYSVSVSNTGRVKVCDLSKALMVFSQKGYLTRARTFHKLKGGADSEIIYRKIVHKDDLKDMKLTVRKFSEGKTRASSKKTINIGDATIQGYSGSGSASFPTFKDTDSVSVEEG